MLAKLLNSSFFKHPITILLFKLLRSERWWVFYLFCALFILALSQGFFLLLIGPFLEGLFLLPEKELLNLSDLVRVEFLEFIPFLSLQIERSSLVILLPSGLILAALLRNIAMYIYQRSSAALTLLAAKYYRDYCFRQILRLPYSFSCQRSPSAWMSTLMNDVHFLQGRFTELCNALLRDVVLIVSSLFVISVIHPYTAIFLLLTLPFVAIIMGKSSSKIAVYLAEIQKKLADINNLAWDIRKRLGFIRLQQGEEYELKRLNKVNLEYYGVIRRSLFLRSTFAPVVEFVGVLFFAGLIFYQRSGQVVSGQSFVVLFSALGLLFKPLKNLGAQVVKYQETIGSLSQSLKLWDKEPIVKPTKPSLSLPQDGIYLDRVASGYFNNIKCQGKGLVLRPGEMTAIIGPSASGKSTLLKTLAGLLEPLVWQGSCEFNAFKGQSAWVGQRPFLFRASIHENLTYGLQGKLDPERLKTALEQAGCAEEILGKLNVYLNPLQQNISGGQWQRLAIARALLQEQQLYLFDEATANIDAAAEFRLLTELQRYCRVGQRIFLMVTHRLENLDFFEQVWFVENGEVCFNGSPKDLVKTQRYREFHGAI